MKKIGLFGGALDPITIGHEKIIKKLLEEKIVDEIWLLPCYISAYGKNMTNFHKRVDMLNIIAKKYNDKVKVDDFECREKSNGETCHMVKKFFEVNDPNKYYFVLGMDNANKIHTWNNWEGLINMIPFIIIPRGEYQANKNGWYQKPPHSIVEYLSDDISSTRVRSDIKNKGNSEYLDNDVMEYIKINKLYLE